MNKWFATVSFIALSSAAYADNHEVWPKWYVGLSGGVTYLDDADVSGTTTGELTFDTGSSITGSIGYILPYGMHPLGSWRIEAEAGYRQASLDSYTTGGVASAAPGKTRIASYMANAYYDWRSASRFTPYLGAGIGLAKVSLSKSSGLGNTGDGEDTVLAYQGMVGIAYAPQSMPNTEWLLGYRYFVADSPEYDTAGGKAKLDDIMIHSAEIGARLKF